MSTGMLGKVLIAAPVDQLLIIGLERLGYEVISSVTITQQQGYDYMKDCVGVITSTRLQLDRTLIDAAPKLKWIGRMGSGMEVIDQDYAAEKNIVCFGSPGGISNAVGEHALGMLLDLLHHISKSNRQLQQEIWQREENRGFELEGKTIGIIGFGHTGKAFAKKLMGFDVNILAYDINKTVTVPSYVNLASHLQPIYEHADIVSFHVPQLPSTKYYFNDDFLDKMKKPFILINTSRGRVADTNTIYNGLHSGKIIGACLDVFESEPINYNNPLFKNILVMDQVIATPHIAGYTFDALKKMSQILLEKVEKEIVALKK